MSYNLSLILSPKKDLAPFSFYSPHKEPLFTMTTIHPHPIK